MPSINRFLSALKQSVTRSDFRRNPFKAGRKRLWWKLRWKLFHRLWLLTLDNRMLILVPHSGAGALIYYLGHSEPETADFFSQYLCSGMTVFDIGAHLGEYTMRAARQVGQRGRVYAFEPNPDLVDCIHQNITLNHLENVTVVESAVADQNGKVSFEIAAESSISALTTTLASAHKAVRTIRVEAVTLDTFWASRNRPKIDLIKIDVEGAEYMVFQGASELLSQSPEHAPVLVFEFNPTNYANFGFTCEDLLILLAQYNYRFYSLTELGKLHPTLLKDLLESPVSQNVVASKSANTLFVATELED